MESIVFFTFIPSAPLYQLFPTNEIELGNTIIVLRLEIVQAGSPLLEGGRLVVKCFFRKWMLASVVAIQMEGWLTIQTPKRFAQANVEKSCFRSNRVFDAGSWQVQNGIGNAYSPLRLRRTEDRDLTNQSMWFWQSIPTCMQWYFDMNRLIGQGWVILF